MPIYQLTDEHVFPAPEMAEPDGLLAIGGDLHPRRLLLAYANGIFPWPHDDYPLLWFSPDPRFVLPVSALHVSRRLARTIRRNVFEIRLDTDCEGVIHGCAEVDRRHEPGTWITHEMIDAYVRLHRMGFVHSAEAWRDGRLVGGLYGVCLGGVFVGESMFAVQSDASKVAFVTLLRQLGKWGIDLFDAQVPTAHVASFGAVEWPRADYLTVLRSAVAMPSRQGRWQLDG